MSFAFFNRRHPGVEILERRWRLPPPKTTACLSNLRAIEGAKVTRTLEYRKDKTDVPNDSDLFGASLYIREKLICPLGGIYTLEGVDKSPVSSIHGDINSYNRNPVTGSPRP